jgi:hypothetical protein
MIVKTAHVGGLVEWGDMLVLIAGVPFGAAGTTNFLKVHRVGESGEVPERVAADSANS